ncbi:Putative restriction endonuclease [Methylomagnum ishizawai]|uniref:Restriction endonuclease n=1 Tax=Methylomagnum ishizawai TaxID=1760988 RepID=A0A1Y6CYB8_9GAMM|nr:Uma2 family endonuclease [Methylomagnum ishizawai]SMF95230.1 Putative restriction endonuclease [Methylomagnum ishizawai]
MDWDHVWTDALLSDLPFKVELDQWGQIVMNPMKVRHVLMRNIISDQLKQVIAGYGKTLQCLPVMTPENVKMPDVVWFSPERYEQMMHSEISPIMPEVCVEVLAPGENVERLLHKKDLYLRGGAVEFWLCDDTGKLSFYDDLDVLEYSRLIPAFPHRVEPD